MYYIEADVEAITTQGSRVRTADIQVSAPTVSLNDTFAKNGQNWTKARFWTNCVEKAPQGFDTVDPAEITSSGDHEA